MKFQFIKIRKKDAVLFNNPSEKAFSEFNNITSKVSDS